MKPRRPPAPLLAVLAATLFSGGCATRPDVRPAEVEAEWIQPRVDQAARDAAICVRKLSASDLGTYRTVEIEVDRTGAARGFVEPYPAPPGMQSCADTAAADLHAQPSFESTRSFARGDGALGNPRGDRERALALRARLALDRKAADACRAAWQARNHIPPNDLARIGFVLVVGKGGVKEKAEPYFATANVDPDTRACFTSALRQVHLSDFPGTYHFSYLFSARGLIIGAPDVYPLDPYDKQVALAAVQPAAFACLEKYTLPGRILAHVTVNPDGIPTGDRIERAAVSDEDLDADACLRRALLGIRIPPFDGKPLDLTVSYDLRR